MDKKNLDLATQLRHELHAHPELSLQEVWTKQHLMDFLRAHTGLEVVDRGRWFYAFYSAGAGKPAIAYRADFDALPILEKCEVPWKSQCEGVSHKCGHDGHAAALAGFALEVDQKGADKNIYFIFQHAEESGDGGEACAKLIPEKGISEVFAWHNMPGVPKGTAIMRAGSTNCATMGMSIYFTGFTSHAAHPEEGRSPAQAVAEMMLAVPEYLDSKQWERFVLVTIVGCEVGDISKTDALFGTTPGAGAVHMTARAEKEAEMFTIVEGLEAKGREIAEKYGLKVGYRHMTFFPEVLAHAESVDKIRAACAAVGVPVIEMPEPGRAGEDFGWYTKQAPGAMFHIGAGDGPAVHTHEYDFEDDLIEPAVEIFKNLAGTPV